MPGESDVGYHGEVLSVLKKLANPEYGERVRKDRGSKLKFLGIGTPELRRVAKEGFSFYGLSDAEILGVWDGLWHRSPYNEVLALALYYYTPIVRKDASPDLWPVMKGWSGRVENWAHSDGLSSIYSWILEQHHDLVMPTLRLWNTSDELWLRRLSLVSLIHNTGKNAVFLSPEDVLPLVTVCLDDDRHYVQTAVGWVLREMMNAHPEEIVIYVEENASLLPPKAFARAIERLNTAEKNRLRQIRKNRPVMPDGT